MTVEPPRCGADSQPVGHPGSDPLGSAVVSGFVDECQINVRGGDGGAGCVAVRREAHVAKGGPDGGDGGKGGDVWFVADRNVASLLAFRDHPHRRAENGTHGQGKKKHGAGGHDHIVHMPEGTVVLDRDGVVLADLVHAGDRWLAAAGGRGGKGNARFLSNKRRAPMFAEQGEVGEERWLNLELKLMADVALVGFPNVGKSTLVVAGLGGQAQDRRLPLHDPRAQPRGRASRRRLRVRRGRHPRPDRRGQRGPGPRPPVPAPHRTGEGPRTAHRSRRGRHRDEHRPPRRAGRRPARANSASTSPTSSTGPDSSSGRVPISYPRSSISPRPARAWSPATV